MRRERTEIERDIANYTVIEHDGIIFGCAALYPYPESRTGEMAALTVSPQVQGQGDGERILKRIEQRARAIGLESIFVLTHAHDALVHQARVRAGRPRAAARGAKEEIQLGPALAGAGQETRLKRCRIHEEESDMTRMVQCVYLKKEAAGLDFSPYPGELGKRIYDNVSKEAFEPGRSTRRCWSMKTA